jgi:hypothetical protein
VRPILVTNPRLDLEFHTVTQDLVGDGVESPDELATALRAKYPDVVVRARGLAGESRAMWYVYRDGRWVGADG